MCSESVSREEKIRSIQQRHERMLKTARAWAKYQVERFEQDSNYIPKGMFSEEFYIFKDCYTCDCEKNFGKDCLYPNEYPNGCNK